MAKKVVEWNKLVEESLSGSKGSSNVLMKKTERYLNAISAKTFNKIIPEVIAASLMKIWNHLDSFDSSKSKYTTWAAIIMKRTYYKFHNKLNKEKDTLIHTDNIYESALLDQSSESESLRYEEYITSLRELLISDDSYRYLYHYYIRQMSYDDIATHLDCNLSTVKTRIRREKKALREVLQNPADI